MASGANTMKPIVRVEKLTRVYDEGANRVYAVQDACLQVAPGEVVAVMGPSGSGKTTLLSMVGCLLRPTSGRIFLHDTELTALPEAKLPGVRRKQIGFVFQA